MVEEVRTRRREQVLAPQFQLLMSNGSNTAGLLGHRRKLNPPSSSSLSGCKGSCPTGTSPQIRGSLNQPPASSSTSPAGLTSWFLF